MHLYMALVDTGASCTCISQKVIQDLGLAPIGKVPVGHAQGIAATNSYQFQVVFAFPSGPAAPTGVVPSQVLAIPVIGVEFMPQPGSGFDMLLGRDILCRGVFSMSFDGHAIFSI
jgi:predicted aspartyl protease